MKSHQSVLKTSIADPNRGFSRPAGSCSRVVRLLKPAILRPGFSRTLYRVCLACCLLLPAVCHQQTPMAEKISEKQLVQAGRQKQSVLPDGPNIILKGKPGDRLLASYDGLEMYETEFYHRLGGSIHWHRITGPDKLEGEDLLWGAIREGLSERNIRREAERNGANDDALFIKFLDETRLKTVYGWAASTLRPTLPEPYVLDMSLPGDDELQSKFVLWQRVEVKAEPIWVHYIVLRKREDDPEHNEIQLRKAELVLARIRSGEDFVDVKMELSEVDSPSREPWMFERRDHKLQPLREIIEHMEAGEVSEVLERGTAYYIFYVLPDQEWNDFSSLEAIKANPPLLQKLIDHTISQRMHNKPVHDYIDTQLEIPPGYRELDLGSWPPYEMPPHDTVLVALDDQEWTLHDLEEITALTMEGRDPLTRDDVERWAKRLRYDILLTDQVDRGNIEIEEEEYMVINWEIRKTAYYGKWLEENLWKLYLLTEPGDQQEEENLIDVMKESAQEHIDGLTADVIENPTLHMPLDQINIDRIRWFDPDKYGERVPEPGT